MDVPILEGIDLEDMSSGDGVFWRGVAQEKPAIRKRVLAELGDKSPLFSVRYVGGGVQLRRL